MIDPVLGSGGFLRDSNLDSTGVPKVMDPFGLGACFRVGLGGAPTDLGLELYWFGDSRSCWGL